MTNYQTFEKDFCKTIFLFKGSFLVDKRDFLSWNTTNRRMWWWWSRSIALHKRCTCHFSCLPCSFRKRVSSCKHPNQAGSWIYIWTAGDENSFHHSRDHNHLCFHRHHHHHYQHPHPHVVNKPIKTGLSLYLNSCDCEWVLTVIIQLSFRLDQAIKSKLWTAVNLVFADLGFCKQYKIQSMFPIKCDICKEEM